MARTICPRLCKHVHKGISESDPIAQKDQCTVANKN